ncbi:uncharacterized protein TrAtP1_002602 [Trichoderma atroviride]|uniref:Uncharacterized protein n=1 Tax=Hypocrea atroviridis (strain ATCC 20476 / IMI 206040) TaxID=452589 RepID=G9P0M0_HYPAI|nr:uncharacterized protein TRIATDRAFT_319836 [Trichoderma atroviride IMI 206040]EHK42391.1 hypothetical protein TRIATDRAFT_319836 [Trichoderma atroviride IMI 206040]UKZ61336.1 hypothetical protein TrAtP1_002602 [Trichoderma atroviride]
MDNSRLRVQLLHDMDKKIGHTPDVCTSDMIPICEATTDPAWDATFGASKRAAIRTEALARRQLSHDKIFPGWSTIWETFSSKERGAKVCGAR